MAKFLYVFTRRDRDKLILRDYSLLKSDEKRDIYIFENSGDLDFAANDIRAVPSDIFIL